MKLSKQATRIICNTFEHFAEDEENFTLAEEFNNIRAHAKAILDNPTLHFTLHQQERFPTLKDEPLITELATKAIDLEWGSPDQIYYENALFAYLKGRYDFDCEEHEQFFNRATTDEAIKFALKTIKQEHNL